MLRPISSQANDDEIWLYHVTVDHNVTDVIDVTDITNVTDVTK